ncbi:MAG: hypothetical protein N4A54_04010 [Peptostreptococcaceae bacterium]|jgi:hypothetical protein|nr:hypothetical protein [Peptostreptococcaceae bacterium]
MSYIKEFEKKVFDIPGESGKIIVTKYSDSGEFDLELDLEKIHYNIVYANSKKDYVERMKLNKVNIETGYIRQGLSPEQYDSKEFEYESYMKYQEEIFKNPLSLDPLFENFIITYKIYRKKGMKVLEDKIIQYDMKKFNPNKNSIGAIFKDHECYEIQIKDINTLLEVLKNYEYIWNDNFHHRVEIKKIPIYRLVHEWGDDVVYIKFDINTKDVGDILAYLNFTCEDFIDDIQPLNIEFAKMLEKFYKAEIIENVSNEDPYEIIEIDLHWNREKHCGNIEFLERFKEGNIFFRTGIKEYCKELMEREELELKERRKYEIDFNQGE